MFVYHQGTYICDREVFDLANDTGLILYHQKSYMLHNCILHIFTVVHLYNNFPKTSDFTLIVQTLFSSSSSEVAW